MGIKRTNEETNAVSEKKSKSDTPFSMELFLKNLKDPESSFLGNDIRFSFEKIKEKIFL